MARTLASAPSAGRTTRPATGPPALAHLTRRDAQAVAADVAAALYGHGFMARGITLAQLSIALGVPLTSLRRALDRHDAGVRWTAADYPTSQPMRKGGASPRVAATAPAGRAAAR